MMNYKELFISSFLDSQYYAAVIIELETHRFYNALFEACTIGGGHGYSLSKTGEAISFEQVQKLADKSEDERAFKYKRTTSENLNDARYQAEQMFQRGGLDREQAYAAYGLDSDGNKLK